MFNVPAAGYIAGPIRRTCKRYSCPTHVQAAGDWCSPECQTIGESTDEAWEPTAWGQGPNEQRPITGLTWLDPRGAA